LQPQHHQVPGPVTAQTQHRRVLAQVGEQHGKRGGKGRAVVVMQRQIADRCPLGDAHQPPRRRVGGAHHATTVEHQGGHPLERGEHGVEPVLPGARLADRGAVEKRGGPPEMRGNLRIVEQARRAEIDMRAQGGDGALPMIEKRLEPLGIERHVIEPLDGLGTVRIGQRYCRAATRPRRVRAVVVP
jgi:hypothetical protein